MTFGTFYYLNLLFAREHKVEIIFDHDLTKILCFFQANLYMLPL